MRTYHCRNIQCSDQVCLGVPSRLVSYENIGLVADSRYFCSIISKLNICFVSDFPKKEKYILFEDSHYFIKQYFPLFQDQGYSQYAIANIIIRKRDCRY